VSHPAQDDAAPPLRNARTRNATGTLLALPGLLCVTLLRIASNDGVATWWCT